MRSTLFHIPRSIPWGDGVVPLFGFGVLLLAWVVLGGAWFARVAMREGLSSAVRQLGLPLVAVAAMLGWILPVLDDGAGIPVRGYGVMLLVAAACGTWLSVVRARRVGIDADTILALATEVFLWGLIGARLFYVIEYHDQFFAAGKPLVDSLRDVVNIAAGGLVVFGSLPTAAWAAWRFARRRRLSFLELADCVVPGMLVGLAIGRVGCFLNGCCYGGPCDLPWGVSFPAGTEVAARYPAAAGGPSVSVHPAQLYAAIDAALLAGLAVAWTPLARRTGEVLALVLTLHPISRMLLEAIRVDEPPALGTPLSISQLVSIVLLCLAGVLWWWISRQPLRPPAGQNAGVGTLPGRTASQPGAS
jgi:phosphatidylglycerol:prolipoprotein diacylglycerol transferase